MDEGNRQCLQMLLVEDNLINRKVAQKMLRRLGHNADLAVNGKEAVQALERRPYQIAFMDIHMPEMDGIETTRIIRERLVSEEQPHIVAVTTYNLEYSREMCFQSGTNGYIGKPVILD